MAERLTSIERIHRLLAVLRHAASHPSGIPIDDLGERFGLRRDQLLRELDMAAMVGGDSADFHEMPFEVFVDGDLVFCRLFGLDDPFRLTPEEGLALVASADALTRGETADSPLRRGLDKIAAVLGLEHDDAVAVDIAVLGGPTGQLLDEAIRSRRSVRFHYWTYGSDDVSVRTVDPWRVFSVEGAWYLLGVDRDRGAERRFRIDRIDDPEILDDPIEHRAPKRPDLSVEPDDAPIAVLDLTPQAGWVVESFPVTRVEDLGGGHVRIELPVAGRSWLERLLLRLGEDAVLVELDPVLGDRDVVAEAARRILSIYRGPVRDS